MKLNREGVQLNAEERNKRNQNWATLEVELDGIGEKIADSGDAKELAENVQAQVNALVVQGDSSVEARQARVDAKGVEAATLKARLDAEQNAFTQQLAETGTVIADRTFYNNLSVHKRPKATFTVQDDDTRIELYTKIFPILQELNVKITSAVITANIGKPGFITLAQFIEMRDSGLVEFVSHTHNHLDLSTLTPEEVEYELVTSKNWIIEHGGNPDHFVPPFGGVNNDVRERIKKYYKDSFQTISVGYLLTPPLQTYAIRRSDFDVSKVTVAEQKSRLDATKTSDGWLVVNTHSQYPSFSAEDLREVFLYALSIGVEIVTTSEGMKRFGNKIEIESDPTNEAYSGMDVNGNRFGDLNNQYYMIGATNITAAKTADTYKKGTTIATFTNALATSYGWPGAGTLTVTKPSTNALYTVQDFLLYQSNEVLRRYWNGTTWTAFVAVASAPLYNHISRTGITSTTPISEFKEGISTATYNSSAASTSGFVGAGTLQTTKVGTDDYGFQRFIYFQQAVVLHRYWKNGAWSSFINISGNERGATSARNAVVTADIPVGHPFFDTTLRKATYWTGTAWVDALGNTV